MGRQTISYFRISEIDEFCALFQLRTELGLTPIRIDQTCIHFSLPLLSLTPLAHASSSYGVPRRWRTLATVILTHMKSVPAVPCPATSTWCHPTALERLLEPLRSQSLYAVSQALRGTAVASSGYRPGSSLKTKLTSKRRKTALG